MIPSYLFMLILCTGPDTFRAQRKARELEEAFRTKYDPSGLSIEHLAGGKTALQALTQRAGTRSLFSSRRFLRGTQLLEEVPDAKVKILAKILAQDQEGIIVVTTEHIMPSAKYLEAMAGVKVIKYEFPQAQGEAFHALVRVWASEQGIANQAIIDRIAMAAEGDSWLAWNELAKCATGRLSELTARASERSIFDEADDFLRNDPQRFARFVDSDAAGIFSPLMAAARAYLRARDGAGAGLSSYVVRKLSHLRAPHAEATLSAAIRAHRASRTSYGSEAECHTLLT